MSYNLVAQSLEDLNCKSLTITNWLIRFTLKLEFHFLSFHRTGLLCKYALEEADNESNGIKS